MAVVFAKLLCTFMALAGASLFTSDLVGETSRLGRIARKAAAFWALCVLGSAIALAWSL